MSRHSVLERAASAAKSMFRTDAGSRDISAGHQKVPFAFLRDNCQCEQCRNGHTQQRTNRFFENNTPASVQRLSEHAGRLQITWTDGHRSSYSRADILNRHNRLTDQVRRAWLPARPWPGIIPAVSLATLGSSGHKTLAVNLRTYGFCMITGVEASLEASEQVMQSIGPIRNTHFGGSQIVQADLSSKDTAYTRSALDMHTDTTYYTLPIRLLGMHLLSHRGCGGESILVDGFRAASDLRSTDAQAYRTLASLGVYHHASGNSVSVQPDRSFPILEHDDRGSLLRLRYNNADRAHVTGDYEQVAAWYEASRKFASIINGPAYRLQLKLQPGSLLLIDNWRVLHGRTGYDGDRRLFTAYVDHDDCVAYLKQQLFNREQIAMTYAGL